MSKLAQLHPDLQAVFKEAFADWKREHPESPQPFISQSSRSQAEQDALYAQGRQPLAAVNKLRAIAGMAPISEKENVRVSNARFGESAHNFTPARAGDVAFLAGKGKLDWTPGLFSRLNTLMMAAAAELGVDVEWGGLWKTRPNAPHWQLRHWRTMK